MGDKEDYLTAYRVFFENFAATVNHEDQLPVNIAGYTITEAELPGEVLYWTTQYLTEKSCPLTLLTPLRRIILDEVRIASKKQPIEYGYKSDEAVYIALRLMQAVAARVNDVCLRYLDNSRLDSLPPPPALRDMKTVSCATKNSRRVMEDRHVEIGNLEALFGIETTERTSFYAVYDGHAGSAAATYCAAHLHQYLVESPHFHTDLQRAMRDCFLRTDTEFVRKSNQERACGGSTAVVVTIRGSKLLAAWAGDSLALLAKRMRLMQLVRPHKPGRQDERDRIESTGGTVMYWGTWRVNGQLAVSRAIGDAQYKPYVTARPETAIVDLDGDEDFVVVACDGLWDFVSEDDVALSVYRQISADPDDLKAVTKRLVVQAKRQGSTDNISIIVVFLKEPRVIAAENCPPMDLGLDNALATAPPFSMESEVCKRLDAVAAEAEAAAADADNGVDHSDSDSEDLGPETAVDADDLEADNRNHEPAAPTPPAHAVEESHVDGALVDNVAESGEESEDEWNYFKGEGEREHNDDQEADEPPRSETPCQDNSAWETSSVDMNSSPLNPDAPVFVPGGVAGADVLLAESPRKPLPMDDIELPDVAQFRTEAVVRPAELLDLDNCDQLNGHHNVSIDDAVKEHFNGNDKCNMDSLGFGFNVGIEPEKLTDTDLIQDFERIQKDTTDFCNIQVFQAHTETNPFATDDNDDLFERLKNKERDPMSMSFYQEKDDDTCERLGANDSRVDLNAVQPLPDSDDEDIKANGVCDMSDGEKENVSPDQHTDLLGSEPNNDIIRFDDRTDMLGNNAPNFGQGDNFIDYSSNNMQNYSNNEFDCNNIPQEVAQTDTPESHKLLFEQIPEIPDGKSSELGFAIEDVQDPSESEKDVRVITPQDEMSQDVEMESKLDDSPCEETHPELSSESELKEEPIEAAQVDELEQIVSPAPDERIEKENEIIPESALDTDQTEVLSEQICASPARDEKVHSANAASPEVDGVQENIVVDIHQDSEPHDHFDTEQRELDEHDDVHEHELDVEVPEIQFESELLTQAPVAESPLPSSPLPSQSPLPALSPAPATPAASLPAESPAPTHLAAESPFPTQSPLPTESPLPVQSPKPSESPIPTESPMPAQSLPTESPLPAQSLPTESPLPAQSLPTESPQPAQSLLTESPMPTQSLPSESPLPAQSLPTESPLPAQSLPSESPLPAQCAESPVPPQSVLSTQSPMFGESPLPSKSPLITESPAPIQSPLPVESPVPTESPAHSPLPTESPLPVQSLPTESPAPAVSPLPVESPVPAQFLLPTDSPAPAQSPFPTESPAPAQSPLLTESLVPSQSPLPTESPAPAPAASPLPAEVPLPRDSPAPPSPAPPAEAQPTGPAPDILPEPARSDLITDIDVGVPESRAQEICVPVTSEIQREETIGAGTPPPTPAVEAEVPIAAAVAAAAAVAGAATAAVAAKKAPAKKTPTPAKTSKPAPKAATPRTPLSAKKPAAPAAAAAAAKSPAAAPKAATARVPTAARPAAAPAAPKSAPAGRTTPKSIAAPAKPAPRASPAPRAAPAPAPSKPVKEPAVTAKSAPTTRAAPRPAAPRPAAPAARPAPAAARSAVPRAASATAAPRPRPTLDKKPLTNGDVKVPPKPAAARPAPARAAAAPAAAPARPAPRPTPRALPAAPPTTKSVVPPKPQPRAARPTPAPTKDADKQSKDLANKRITAKAAPPRTATTKAPLDKKTAVKAVPKRSIELKKEPVQNGIHNGAEPELTKPPPSPPAADNALLPDVIA